MQVEHALPVPPALRPWISGMAVGSVVGPARTVLEAPDHAVSLTLRSTGEVMVMGPRTTALYSHGVPGPSCLTLRIRPGLAPAVLGRPVAGLADRAVPLAEFSARLAVLPGTLQDRLAATLSNRPPLGDLAAAVEALLEGVPVAARRLHVSERHLRTLFVERVGVAPKRFARIERLRTVLAHAGDHPWRQLAAEAGYFDQSHLTAEFRRLMGVTPTAWAADRLPAPHRCR